MNTIEVTVKRSVSAQPQLKDFASLKAQGFTTIIDNRLDGEQPAQPASAEEEEEEEEEEEDDAAWAAGLAYVHIPVTSTDKTGEIVRRL